MGQRQEMNKIKEQKNEKIVRSSLKNLHHLLYSWENVVTKIDLWVATKLDRLLVSASFSASPTMCISKSVYLHA